MIKNKAGSFLPLEVNDHIHKEMQKSRGCMLLTTIIIINLFFASFAILRYIISDLFYLAPVIIFCAFTLLYIAVKRGFSYNIAAIILAIFLTVQVGSIGFISGGVSGNATLISPLSAVVTTLLLGTKAGIIVACASSAIIFFMLMLELSGFKFEGPSLTAESLLILRAVIFAVITAILTTICSHYSNQNKKLRNKIWEIANLDYLTGTANRREIDRKLMQLLCQQAGNTKNDLSLLILDIDHFKKFNDKHGHLAGDLCIQAVAATIKAEINPQTDIVGRYGGEEFVAILPSTGLEKAYRMAEKILAGIREIDLEHSQGEFSPITATIGVAEAVPLIDVSIENFMNRADQALYKGKKNGRNQVVCAQNPKPILEKYTTSLT